jgi:hypothetical protein
MMISEYFQHKFNYHTCIQIIRNGFIILLFICTSIYAQVQTYCDTLFLNSGHVYPCKILEINDIYVRITYGESTKANATYSQI